MAEAEAKPKEAPKAEEPKKPDAAKPEAKPEPAKAEAGKEAPAEGAEGAAAAPAAAGKPSKLPIILMVSTFVILPIAGFIVAKLALAPRIAAVQREASESGGDKEKEGKSEKGKKEEGKKEAKKEEPKKGEKEEGKKEEHGKGGKGEKGEGGAKFVLSDQVVNIAGTRGTRFLRAGMEFEAPGNVLAEMEQRKAQVTDIVATALASKRMEELEAPDVRQKLRTEIVGLLNSVLKQGEITNIYFTELIIQ